MVKPFRAYHVWGQSSGCAVRKRRAQPSAPGHGERPAQRVRLGVHHPVDDQVVVPPGVRVRVVQPGEAAGEVAGEVDRTGCLSAVEARQEPVDARESGVAGR
ncbi:hypothetical protein GCM10010230_67450 [Streptomyces narbonensis]|nr:hypothetical protein GCM10010230_67450 [Streptomyces narbonensis]